MFKNAKCKITKRIIMNKQNLQKIHNLLFDLQRFRDPTRKRGWRPGEISKGILKKRDF